ncbi:S8 family peptidase [Deinococcus aestuarii]|uniref:S8 family peptidase n=1 Tax=Deinococcus aestuarii TaxID=2774531 RepID=UPI001C0AE5ED|nr:S8 family serine peptidase [Deinococcus aestuarii]
MRVNPKAIAVLGLTCLLAACGGNGGGGTPSQPVSSISGLILAPGALGSSAQAGELTRETPPDWATHESWWTDPAAARARREARGVAADGSVPGEFIVKRRGSLSAQALATLRVGDTSLRLERPLGLPGVGLYRVTSGGGADVAAVVQGLAARADVEYAQPNAYVQALRTPNDTYFPFQWDAQAMRLPAAWDGTTGKAVTVAVVDTGIVNHPDLAGRILPGLDMVQDVNDSGDGDGTDLNPTDEGGDTGYHGSHVAGTIAAASNNGAGIAGVSWGAKILPIRVLGTSGGGTLDDIIIGTFWAAGGTVEGLPANPNPAQVVNLSLGGKRACSQVEQDLFGALANAGVIAVVAAGNEDDNAGGYAPASCGNVITVGATGPDGKRAPYSNYGARVDVMAPGGNTELLLEIGGKRIPGGILSTVADTDDAGRLVATYGIMEGTSMAAPHVAGLVALMKGEQPGLTTAQALARLKATSTPLSSADCGVSGGCGAGLVNAAAALSTSGGTPTPAPTPAPTPTPVGQVQTFVAALYRLSSGYDESRSHAATVHQDTLRKTYTLGELEPGRYNVAAWQDLDGDEEVDDGEPFGLYYDAVNKTFDVTVDNVARKIIGIDIDMQPYSASASGQAAPFARSSGPLDALRAAAEARTASR